MPAAKFTPVLSQDDHEAAGHVLAAVIAQAFHHRHRAGVADAEALAGHAVDVHLSPGGPEKVDVARDDVVPRAERRGTRGVDDDLPAGEPLGEVVVRVPFQLEGDPVGEEPAEALAGGTAEGHVDGVRRQPLRPVPLGHLRGQGGADRPVAVADGHEQAHLLPRFQRGPRLLDQLLVQGKGHVVVLLRRAPQRRAARHLRPRKHAGEIQAARLPVIQRRARLQDLDVTHHLVHRAEPEGGHDLAHVLCHESHEVHHVLGLAR